MAERKMDKRISNDLQNATQNTKESSKKEPHWKSGMMNSGA